MNRKEQMEDIRQVILNAAKKKGWNQQQLCDQIGVKSSDGFKLMFWNDTLKAETLYKIFIALEMTEQQKWAILKDYFDLDANEMPTSQENAIDVVRKSLELVEKEKEEKEALRKEIEELKALIKGQENK